MRGQTDICQGFDLILGEFFGLAFHAGKPETEVVSIGRLIGAGNGEVAVGLVVGPGLGVHFPPAPFVGFPAHAELLKLGDLVFGKSAFFVLAAFLADPRAEAEAVVRLVGNGDGEAAVFLAVAAGGRKAEAPALFVRVPGHADTVKTPDLVFGERVARFGAMRFCKERAGLAAGGFGMDSARCGTMIFLKERAGLAALIFGESAAGFGAAAFRENAVLRGCLLGAFSSKVGDPVAELQAGGCHVAGRDEEVAMLLVVFFGFGEVAFPLVAERVPAHADFVELPRALLGEQARAPVAFGSAHAGDPDAEGESGGGNVPGRNEKVAMSLVIGLCLEKAALPGKVAVAVPDDADGVKAGDLLLGEEPFGLSVVDFALDVEPAAERKTGFGLVFGRDEEVAAGLVISPGLGVHDIPGGAQGTFELGEERLAVAGLVDNLEGVVHDVLVLAEVLIVRDGRAHFLLDGADAVEALDVEDDVEDDGVLSGAGGEGAADLLFINDGRDGRTEQDDAADIRQMHAFVEHVDAVQKLQMPTIAFFERGEGLVRGGVVGEDAVNLRVWIHLAEPFVCLRDHFVHVAGI